MEAACGPAGPREGECDPARGPAAPPAVPLPHPTPRRRHSAPEVQAEVSESPFPRNSRRGLHETHAILWKREGHSRKGAQLRSKASPSSQRRPPARTRPPHKCAPALGGSWSLRVSWSGNPKAISTIRCVVLQKVYVKGCSRLVKGWKKPLCGHPQACELKERVSYRRPAPQRSGRLQGLCSPASAVGPRQLVATCLQVLSVGSHVTGRERRHQGGGGSGTLSGSLPLGGPQELPE